MSGALGHHGGFNNVGAISVGGRPYAVNSLRLHLSIERFPTEIEFETAQSPGQNSSHAGYIEMGDEILLADAKGLRLFTGWVDAVTRRISSADKSIVVRGRSKCCDLVDCSAELEGSDSFGNGVPAVQIKNKNIIQIAEELCKPYGIKVIYHSKQTPTVVQFMDVNIGDHPYDIIERVARSQNLLLLDDPNGDLVLCDVGCYTDPSSGLELGSNIQDMTVTHNMCNRFSEIDVFDQSVQGMRGIGESPPGIAFDKGVTRHRRYMGFCELPMVGAGEAQQWKQKRADWEVKRRFGRSQQIHATIDQWCDRDGVRFAPNAFAIVNAPEMDVYEARWIIADATWSIDMQSGTTCQLTLMPEAAFNIAPTVLTRISPELQEPSSSGGPKPAGQPAGSAQQSGGNYDKNGLPIGV